MCLVFCIYNEKKVYCLKFLRDKEKKKRCIFILIMVNVFEISNNSIFSKSVELNIVINKLFEFYGKLWEVYGVFVCVFLVDGIVDFMWIR